MKTFKVRLEGASALLQHRMSEEAVMTLLGAKARRKQIQEERLPRDVASDHAYQTEGGKFYIPLTYISGALASVAGDYKQTNSAKRSYKSIIAGCVIADDETATLLDKKGKPLTSFEVDIRRAVNHKAGAIAVCRPRFDEWTCEFTLQIDTDLLPQELALRMLNDAGRRSGIGSYRVSKGGPFGRFNVTKWEEIKA